MCMLYGWTVEYVVGLSFRQVKALYKWGSKYDCWRRGFDVSYKDETKMTREELRELYYTPEERKAQEEYLRKQYGDDIKGL